MFLSIVVFGLFTSCIYFNLMQLYDITFKRMIISAYHSIHDLGTKDIPVRFDAHFSVSFLLEFFLKKIEVVLFLFCNFNRRHCYVFKKNFNIRVDFFVRFHYFILHDLFIKYLMLCLSNNVFLIINTFKLR